MHGHVILSVGRLTFRIYDNAAMFSYVEAWSQALDLGVIFGGGGVAFQQTLTRRRAALP